MYVQSGVRDRGGRGPRPARRACGSPPHRRAADGLGRGGARVIANGAHQPPSRRRALSLSGGPAEAVAARPASLRADAEAEGLVGAGARAAIVQVEGAGDAVTLGTSTSEAALERASEGTLLRSRGPSKGLFSDAALREPLLRRPHALPRPAAVSVRRHLRALRCTRRHGQPARHLRSERPPAPARPPGILTRAVTVPRPDGSTIGRLAVSSLAAVGRGRRALAGAAGAW